MKNLFHNFDWSFKSIAKVLGVFVLGVFTLAIVISVLAFAFRMIASPFIANYGLGGGGYYDYVTD